MSQLFDQICQFYGKDCAKASFSDLCFLASNIGRSLVDGSAIELKSFDGFMNRNKRIQQISRDDTVNALKQLAAILQTKLETMPEKEKKHLELMQQLSAQSELPKRLSDRNL
ncbi:hypothetical protein H6F89_11440 [Cyanobacteria bacterium FACHB-63]|nr:hypothetical protein [Cyanobacteria bacterium FACHB-63]